MEGSENVRPEINHPPLEWVDRQIMIRSENPAAKREPLPRR
jgi:hypothetical protein